MIIKYRLALEFYSATSIENHPPCAILRNVVHIRGVFVGRVQRRRRVQLNSSRTRNPAAESRPTAVGIMN